jgi:hypothetical protein
MNERHGGPLDRGRADRRNDRDCNPHYFVGDTNNSDKVEEDQMTEEEIREYTFGYFGWKRWRKMADDDWRNQ